VSLFENNLYEWRETYFVLFENEKRPLADALATALQQLGIGYIIDNLQANEAGAFEALTLHSPLDNAAMDITYIEGDEVVEQVRDLVRDMREASLTAEERAKATRLASANARFDVFHFEHLAEPGQEDDDEAMDPGSLLLVLERLADLTQGVCIDPQTGSVI
jgi:hypothetical protein